MTARAYDDRGRSHKVDDHAAGSDGPDAGHRLHPAAARDPADRRPLGAGRRRRAAGAHDPRLERARRARLAARLLDRPLRHRLRDRADAVGPRHADRPAARRSSSSGSRALPANTFAPFDPPVVVGDEIDLCLRWPDVPRPPSTAAPLPYPTRADADPPGRGGPAHAAGGLRARRGADPGLGAARRPRHRPLDRQRPAHLLARRDRPLHRRQVAAEVPVQADPDRHPGGPGRAEVVRRRCASPAGCRARSGGPSARSAPRSTTSAWSSRRPRWRPSGGGLRGGSWSISGDRLVLKRYEAVDGVTLTGSGNAAIRLRVAGSKAARGNGHAALRRAPVRARSAGAGSRCASARRTSPRRRPPGR